MHCDDSSSHSQNRLFLVHAVRESLFGIAADRVGVLVQSEIVFVFCLVAFKIEVDLGLARKGLLCRLLVLLKETLPETVLKYVFDRAFAFLPLLLLPSCSVV